MWITRMRIVRKTARRRTARQFDHQPVVAAIVETLEERVLLTNALASVHHLIDQVMQFRQDILDTAHNQPAQLRATIENGLQSLLHTVQNTVSPQLASVQVQTGSPTAGIGQAFKSQIQSAIDYQSVRDTVSSQLASVQAQAGTSTAGVGQAITSQIQSAIDHVSDALSTAENAVQSPRPSQSDSLTSLSDVLATSVARDAFTQGGSFVESIVSLVEDNLKAAIPNEVTSALQSASNQIAFAESTLEVKFGGLLDAVFGSAIDGLLYGENA